jgi:hypothetical protein
MFPAIFLEQFSSIQSSGKKQHKKRGYIIDISWLDLAYQSSTCDVMYRRQRRHLYYGGKI